MSFDYSEFKKYVKKLEKMEKEWDSFIRGFLLEIGLRALNQTKRNHRKRHVYDTGLMMNMWQLGNSNNVVKAVRGKKVKTVKYSADASRSSLASIDSVSRNGDVLEIVLHNPVGYASFVEYGHMTRNRNGWVEGKFVATTAIMDVQRQIPSRYKGLFNKWVRKL